MMPADSPDGNRQVALDDAVAKAVSESLVLVDSLQSLVDEALSALEAVSERTREEISGDKKAEEVVEAFQRELQQSRTEAVDLFKRQRKVLGTVNIALFGRTGAGKSSLIEALVHGDGSTISMGESDFTTEVRPVTWRGCQFIDTPGTNGWGRSLSRELLESRARLAVEVADIVVLCFDTQSQQKGEFEKIGFWVKEYGKPVVAVLNVRNPMWRRPTSVHLGSQRRTLSRAVREHASNIETELAALGIFGAPVVAINAQRAVYARVPGPYRGPAVDQFNRLIQELGSGMLLHGSNFEFFENTIAEALAHHASELRLGMLHAQVRALLERLGRTLAKASEDAKTAAEILDRTVEGLFAVVGYPTAGSKARDAFPKKANKDDLLSWVEKVRGGPYEVTARGKLARYAQQRLEAEIGLLRAKSLSAAEEAVVSAFEGRCDLTPDQFSRKAFQLSQIQSACERVAKEAAAFVQRETSLVIDDARLDVEFLFGVSPDVPGAKGKGTRTSGYIASGAGIALSAASTWLGFAAVGASGTIVGIPAGIALGVASLVTGIASIVAGWFGGRQRKKAEEARQRAWAQAIASARRHVNEVYDGCAKEVSTAAAEMALQASIRLLADPLARAGGLWTLSAEGEEASTVLQHLREELPADSNPQQVLTDAATTVSASFYPGDSACNTLALLGESWINDPVELEADEGTSELLRTRAYDQRLFRRLFEGFRGFVERFGDSIKPGAGTRWLAEAEAVLAQDSLAENPLNELRAIGKLGMPRLQLFGDYSSGKTSFVKRLLVDAGLPVPDSLEVRADPTTTQVNVYEWDNIALIDTPGLQSTQDGHAGIALDACAEASAILCLMQPNLLVGSTDGLEQLLKGDRARGLAPKLDRTIFVIHRADELGADPELVPEEYVRLCQRKKAELQLALASKGIGVDNDRIFCMAADPYQLVGNRLDVSSSQFDRFRSWDGFREFRRAFRDITVRFRRTGVDRSLLEGGLAKLGALDTVASDWRQELALREEALNGLAVVLEEILAEGKRIESEFLARARRMVDDNAFGNLERVAGAASDAELESTAKQLAKWWTLPAFLADVERWQKEASTTIEEWFKRGADQIARTVSAPRFKAAIAGAGGSFDPAGFEGPSSGWLVRILSLVAKPLKGASREVVYSLGKALGATFRPWGAVKLARALGRVGVVLGVVATVADTVLLYRAWKGEKRRTKLRKELRGFVNETATQVLQSLTEEDKEATGPMAYLKTAQDNLSAAAADLALDRTALLTEIAALDARRASYRECMAKAWAALGEKESVA